MNSPAEQYLERIGIREIPSLSAESLARLQEAHLRTVPYENCSGYFLHCPPSLKDEDLLEKIVHRGRGGYCFELNGAFAWLLASLGFQVRQSAARWHFGNPDPLPYRRHRVLLVTLAGVTWIADVGLGSPGAMTPLRLEAGPIQERNGFRYRVVRDPDHGFMLQRETDKGFQNYFSFWDIPHFTPDFLCVNYYCSTAEDSFFRNQLLVNLPSSGGQKRLVTRRDASGAVRFVLSLECPGGTTEEHTLPLTARRELHGWLKTHFGLEVPEALETQRA